MVTRHMSMRGEVVDMERLRQVHGNRPAVGNANLNARGDKLGPGGVVLKTQEQIEAEWAAARAKRAPQPVDIKGPNRMEQALAHLAPKQKPAIVQDDQNFAPPAPSRATATRRRSVDTD